MEQLQQRIKTLENELQKYKNTGREKISKMSSEVVDSNPYSRLMALQRMGIVIQTNMEILKVDTFIAYFHFR